MFDLIGNYMCLQVTGNLANVFLSMHSQITNCVGTSISKAVAVIDRDFGCLNNEWFSGSHVK